MAELTVQTIDIDGLTPSFDSAAAGGDKFTNDGNTFLYMKNDDSSDHTVTFSVQKSIDYGTLTDPTVTVPAGSEELIGPFPREWFSDTDKKVQVTYDDVTSVTVAAIKLG